jgi:hypothetical protein
MYCTSNRTYVEAHKNIWEPIILGFQMWAPKLTMNFNLGNSHAMYKALTKECTPDHHVDGNARISCVLGTSVFGYVARCEILKDIKNQIVQQHGRSAVKAPKQRLCKLATSRRSQTGDTINQWHHLKEKKLALQCSAEQGQDVFLCNDTKSREPVLCHLVYQKKYHDKKYTDNI